MSEQEPVAYDGLTPVHATDATTVTIDVEAMRRIASLHAEAAGARAAIDYAWGESNRSVPPPTPNEAVFRAPEQKMKQEFTFCQLRKNNYLTPGMLFDSTLDSSNQQNAAKYIDTLASLTGTDIDLWKVSDLYNSAGKFPRDKGELNKLFFARKERERILPPESLRPEEVRAISKVLENAKSRAHGEAYERWRRLADQRADLNQKLVHKGLEMLLADQRYKRSKFLSVSKLVSELDQVLSHGFFSLYDYSFGDITLITRPVGITYWNENQGRNNVVNLGQFSVTFSISQGWLKEQVRPHKDNVYYGYNYHPHIDGEQEVCYGQSRIRADKYREEFRLDDLCALIQHVLCNYNEESAYVMIYNLEESFQEERFAPYDLEQAAEEAEDPTPEQMAEAIGEIEFEDGGDDDDTDL